MKRNIDLNEITDGRLYSSGDMVKADCHDCRNCSACCHGMGQSIILDPIDIWRIWNGSKQDFKMLLEKEAIELNMADGLILPNLRMDKAKDACTFLDKTGRCSIHKFRPGLCRLFPLGRYYQENGFKYFIQIHECRCTDRGKIKIKKWLDIPNIKTYEKYITDWHNLLLKCQEAEKTLEEKTVRILTLYILRTFFEKTYNAADEQEFYQEFYIRMEETERKLFQGEENKD